MASVEEAVRRIAQPSSRRDTVYLLLSIVPTGCTVTYGVLAELAGTSPRAVGVYMKTNKNLVVIPCHRVVSARGLGGFSRGLEFKEKLLQLEGAIARDGRLICTIRSVEEYWRTLERSGGEPLPVDA